MSSSNSPQTHQPKSTQLHRIPESRIPIQETSDPPRDTKTAGVQENPAEKETLLARDSEEPKYPVQETLSEGAEGEEDVEGECGFCLFMKGGGCIETFIEWEKCVEEGEKNKEDIVEKCFQATAALKKCMEAHSDYYAPLLQAEKAAKQLEEQKERSNNQGGGGEGMGKKEKE
ncbi:uncharacterized protein LOC105159991 [Sesamum indicum]|uniref:Uncharacterized protein LOC105159991 n=1 Tax=Sesamum indicum TaxID=4182 RepID=A0A6I9SYT1_SESIN|nr:uncharacterized protein LOC105159991 [Sesamum indicum]